MSIGEELLFFLSNSPGNYSRLRERMLRRVGPGFDDLGEGSKIKEDKVFDNSLRVALSRLKKQGLVENKDGLWKITVFGKNKFGKSKFSKKYARVENKQKKSDRKIIIAFDIPEARRKDRNWLRIELVTLGFKKMQQSVWLGPAPLPPEFIEFLKVAKITPFLKFFEVKETDII